MSLTKTEIGVLAIAICFVLFLLFGFNWVSQMGDWIPARSNPHPPVQTVAVGATGDFPKPPGANGFMVGADGLFSITFDGTTASATNGLAVDPGKGGGVGGLTPITVTDKLSVFNRDTKPIIFEVAWLENLN